MVFISLIMVYAMFSISGLILLKKGFTEVSSVTGLSVGKAALQSVANAIFVGGVLIYLTSFLIWLYILSRYELSVAFPVATGVLCLAIMGSSYLLLNEPITVYKVFGTLLIVAGVFSIVKG